MVVELWWIEAMSRRVQMKEWREGMVVEEDADQIRWATKDEPCVFLISDDDNNDDFTCEISNQAIFMQP